ncbi:MAG TPA: alpha-amylase family glycosyl hydrolase [Pyrinomonadaceae bacterium]|nr:alpha-amylase family glycosyl hydrolase [Pyrinomonadaceae bacterium]
MQNYVYPSLYQINTRVWLTKLSQESGKPATLDDIPDRDLDELAEKGFDWIWFLSVWQTGCTSQKVSRSLPELRREFEETLPDLREEDIGGSGFAITGYTAHASLGGEPALRRLRERLRQRGLRLMLDFVPNHTGLDHPWVEEHPEYYVGGTEEDVLRAPHNYGRARRKQGDLVLAYGRDPYFPGWTDTFQLNYGNTATQIAMRDVLMRIAAQCDGVRCDMAMLLLPEVFERTWGIAAEPFWPAATDQVRESYPEFRFMAEVYWDLEWTLQQQGFDYTYDKRLYDRLREGNARPVREHFLAGLDYQNKLARFLENHDEPRAAATFFPDCHKAAAVLTFVSPGLRFFHQGQFEGLRKHISPHLVRAPVEPVDQMLKQFYDRLLAVTSQAVVRKGQWQLLECRPAWEGNRSSDSFITFAWELDDERLLVAVNYSANQAQCYVKLPFAYLADARWQLQDLMGDAVYEREGSDLHERGLYLDEPPWKAMVFALRQT